MLCAYYVHYAAGLMISISVYTCAACTFMLHCIWPK